MLKLSNIYAGYGGIDVIHDISAEVTGNVSIIGPNGCGKTTLLKVIANILPGRGSIEVMGKNYNKLKQREISLRIAMLSQQPSIYFAYNIFDTVMMGRYLHIKKRLSDRPNAEDKEVVTNALKAVDLFTDKDKYITKLSGGQVQRVFLARALAQEPNIILLDEPTNHLDLKCQVDIIEYLKEWAKEGNRSVIGVLHDINLAMRLSDRFIVMKSGKILADGIIDDIIERKVLDSVYEMDVAGYMKEIFEKWG